MSNSKIAVFPGSFDPVTKGHVAVLEKALPLFDKVIIAIGMNSAKQSHFDLDTRKAHLKAVFSNESKIEVVSYSGLTVDFCKEKQAQFIIRGLRDVKDFEYEKSIAIMNNKVASEVETVFFMTDPEFLAINSSIVRDILKNGGNVSQFVPDQISSTL